TCRPGSRRQSCSQKCVLVAARNTSRSSGRTWLRDATPERGAGASPRKNGSHLGSGDRPSSKFGRFENRPGLYPRRLSSQQQCLLWGSVSLDPLRAVRVVTPPRLLLPWALNLGGFGSTAAAHCQPAVSHPPRACETHSGLPLSKGIHFDLICVSRSIFRLEPPECCIGCSMGLSFRFSRAAFERITPSDQPPSPALWRNIVHEYPYLRHLCFSGIS